MNFWAFGFDTFLQKPIFVYKSNASMKKQETKSENAASRQLASTTQMPTIVPPENTFGNEIGKEGDSGSLSDGIDFSTQMATIYTRIIQAKTKSES